MPDWLTASFVRPDIDWRVLSCRLVTAAAFGFAVSGVYRGTRDLARVAASFPGTLVLLSVLIAMVTQVIGDNVALAFSLVGALSIVRFRTAVQDTKDTAFVIFAVAVGMAVGAGHVVVAGWGTLVAGTVAWMFRETPARPGGVGPRTCLVDVRLGWPAGGEEHVRRTLAAHDPGVEAVAAGTAKKGAVVDLTYRLRLPRGTGLARLVGELKPLEGVQGVTIRESRGDA